MSQGLTGRADVDTASYQKNQQTSQQNQVPDTSVPAGLTSSSLKGNGNDAGNGTVIYSSGHNSADPYQWYSGLTTWGTIGNFQGFGNYTGGNDDTDYKTQVRMPAGGLALLTSDGSVGIDADGTVYLKTVTNDGTSGWVPYSLSTAASADGYNKSLLNMNNYAASQVLAGKTGDLTEKDSGPNNTIPNQIEANVAQYATDANNEAGLAQLADKVAHSGANKYGDAKTVGKAPPPTVGPTGQLTGTSTLSTTNDPQHIGGSLGGATTTQASSGTISGSPDIQSPTGALNNAFGSNPNNPPPTPNPNGQGWTTTPPGQTPPQFDPRLGPGGIAGANYNLTAPGQAPVGSNNPVPDVTNPVNHDFIAALQQQLATGDNAVVQNSQSQAIQNANMMRLAAGANTLSGNYASQEGAGQNALALEGQQESQQANLASAKQEAVDQNLLGTALQNESSTELAADAASMQQQVANVSDIAATIENEIKGKTDQQSLQIQQYLNDLTNSINSAQAGMAQNNWTTAKGNSWLSVITDAAAKLFPLLANVGNQPGQTPTS